MILNDHADIPQQRPLHASLRLAIVFILQLSAIYYLAPRVALEGNDYDFDTGLNEFLLAFIPTVLILFLIPVMFRGSSWQKAFTAILLPLPMWVAFWGWYMIIGRFTDYFFSTLMFL